MIFITIDNVYLFPNIVIKDVYSCEKALEEYIETTKSVDIKSTKYDENHQEDYFLFALHKNMCNEDFQDFESFVRRRNNSIKDKSFE